MGQFQFIPVLSGMHTMSSLEQASTPYSNKAWVKKFWTDEELEGVQRDKFTLENFRKKSSGMVGCDLRLE